MGVSPTSVDSEQLPGANSDCHQTWSVISLATGDEVIKFLKVKVGGGGMHATERRSSSFLLQLHEVD